MQTLPQASPELVGAFLRGAAEVYAKHGIDDVKQASDMFQLQLCSLAEDMYQQKRAAVVPTLKNEIHKILKK